MNGSRRIIAAGLAAVALVYGAAIVVGMRVRDLGWMSELPTFPLTAAMLKKPAWTPPSPASIPLGAKGESIRSGMAIFNETPLYAAANATARLSCANCHAEGGIQPYASPMVGVGATFPQFNARAGHVISLKDRIQECFVRSENGKPIDYDGATMHALVDYIGWLSTPEPQRKPYVGRGLVKLADLRPDPIHGRQIYAAQCAGCHGQNGEGRPHVFPPLWGPDSFNDGAGMHGVKKMAAFVKQNMPQNRMGVLSAQEAYDVAEFIHEQPRPKFNAAYAKY
jgi:thiosulfate dehydrogenase